MSVYISICVKDKESFYYCPNQVVSSLQIFRSCGHPPIVFMLESFTIHVVVPIIIKPIFYQIVFPYWVFDANLYD
jgi:hypothetical protein